MSVAAWTPTATIASEAARLSVTITSTAWRNTSSGTRPRLWAVVMMPIPSGLVSTSASPGRAPWFVMSRSG